MKYKINLKSGTASDDFILSFANFSRHKNHLEKNLVLLILDVHVYSK